MKQQSWIVVSLVFAVIIAVFAVINVENVEVDFLFTTTTAPLILVILLSVLMGAILIVGFSFSKIFQLQRDVKQLRNENEQLKQKQSTDLTPESKSDSTEVQHNDEQKE
ncbi:DUF1049 domain-containing protein [Filobacillus milosensis]|uniref:DUF1049 domain-containing protein n=1 Tax=Filobacillus milosensis TaxID=94137 RepID=A0A4Y8IVD0_9BACI|nr:lipopolysaccharide assembly protein LapA domain-containing protein [Filobacillus milosensis]TFB24907.1 DUF1049 domain-containing protein [Filobacillus milosensis]